jgi:hypothetical protein
MSNPRLLNSLAPTSRHFRNSAAAGELDLRRVLLHPAWIGGLLVLAVNDHLLKGAGVLPGAVTGKLSDFAGLFVAPALFALLLGVRKRTAFVAAHALVGLVFAGLQLSPAFAATWSQLFGLIGIGWVTTMDPTDLLALVALGASYRFWTPRALETGAVAAQLATPWKRGATVGAAFTGVMVSAATSPPPEFDEFYPDLWAQTFVHNQSDVELAVLLRPIRADIQIDCDAVSLDPGGLLPDSAFEIAERWELPARTSISAWTSWDERECYAVWVSGDTFPPFIMFWDGSVEQRLIPGELPEGSALPSFGVAVISEPDGTVTDVRDTSTELAFVPTAGDAEIGESCELVDPGARLDWVDIPNGDYEVASVDFGVDGCLRLGVVVGNGSHEGYICMPHEAFPFRGGDFVSISGNGSRLTVSDQDESVEATRYLRLDRGEEAPSSNFFEMAAREKTSCAFSVDLDCVDVARPAELLIVGEVDSATLQAGAGSSELELPDGRTAQMELTYGASRVALDAECAAGGNGLGADIDLVTLIQTLP